MVAAKGRLAKVLARARWQCQMPACLCPDGRAIDRALAGTSQRWAPSEDHVIPRSEGGSSSLGNLRAAHRYCNSCRGSGGRTATARLILLAGQVRQEPGARPAEMSTYDRIRQAERDRLAS